MCVREQTDGQNTTSCSHTLTVLDRTQQVVHTDCIRHPPPPHISLAQFLCVPAQ